MQPDRQDERVYATPMVPEHRWRIHAELDQILVGIVPERLSTSSRVQRYRWLDAYGDASGTPCSASPAEK